MRARRRQITSGAFEFHADAWSGISREAQDLVSRMLTVDPAARIDMSGVLAHPWVVAAAPAAGQAAPPHLGTAITNLRRFNVGRKLRAAARAAAWAGGWVPGARAHALTALVGPRRLSGDELTRLAAAFRAACASSPTGTVTLPQFRHVLAEAGAGELPAARIFALFDADGSGDVDVKELLVGLGQLRSSNPEHVLRFAFDAYDADGSGYLSREELLALLVGSGALAAADALQGAGDGGSGTAHDAGPADAADVLHPRLLASIEAMDSNRDGKGAWPPSMAQMRARPVRGDKASAANGRRGRAHPLSVRGGPAAGAHVPDCALRWLRYGAHTDRGDGLTIVFNSGAPAGGGPRAPGEETRTTPRTSTRPR